MQGAFFYVVLDREWQGYPAISVGTSWDFRRFRKGVGGRGLATNKTPKRASKVFQKCVPILLRGHRKKGTEKRPESLAFQGFFAPTPSVRQPLFETSEIWACAEKLYARKLWAVPFFLMFVLFCRCFCPSKGLSQFFPSQDLGGHLGLLEKLWSKKLQACCPLLKKAAHYKILYEKIGTNSTTTRGRNLQFRGAVSTGGSPLDFLLFLQVLFAI